MTPRVHNITSYGVALGVRPAVVLARSELSDVAVEASSVALPVAIRMGSAAACRYRRRFDEASAAPYPRERRALIPFVF